MTHSYPRTISMFYPPAAFPSSLLLDLSWTPIVISMLILHFLCVRIARQVFRTKGAAIYCYGYVFYLCRVPPPGPLSRPWPFGSQFVRHNPLFLSLVFSGFPRQTEDFKCCQICVVCCRSFFPTLLSCSLEPHSFAVQASRRILDPTY